MTGFSVKKIKAQLDNDTDGAYQKWLLEKLQGYKSEVESSLQQMLAPEEYDRLSHLDRALTMALLVVSSYSTGATGQAPTHRQTDSLSNVFNP